MAVSAFATAAGVIAGKKAFETLVGDLYGFLAEATGRKRRQWKTAKQIDSLFEKIAQVRSVKTIWQVDKAVDLKDFYCDSRIEVDKKRRVVRKLADFGPGTRILVEGVAGQGKSILLRYLCAQELLRGEFVPLFVELRRIDKAHSLKDRITMALKALGLTVDDDLYEALAKSGKILLLLDAFDEIQENEKASVLTDIEDLAATNENMRIVITSRPQQAMKASTLFDVARLSDLQDDEYAAVIRRLAGGRKEAKRLIDHVESKKSNVRGLLTTPLMVTLLVLRSRPPKRLPTAVSDFYKDLFQTFLQRHDGTKPGFARERKCGLDDTEYQDVFEALCLLAKKSGEQTFTARKMRELVVDALRNRKLKAKATAYINDIVTITCLIVREGDEHRFIHKTVQEYYTAAYVKTKTDSWAEDFYRRILGKNAWDSWGRELEFLSEIDSPRHSKYYALPEILQFLGISEQDLEAERKPLTLEQLKRRLLPFHFIADDGDVLYMMAGTQTILAETRYKKEFLDVLVLLPRLGLREGMLPIVKSRGEQANLKLPLSGLFRLSRYAGRPAWGDRISLDRFTGEGPRIRATIDVLRDDDEIVPALLKTANEFCFEQFELAREIVASTREQEDSSLLDDLI